MEWTLMYVICEGFWDEETWYTNEDETLFRIVFADGSEKITDDPDYWDDGE